MKTKEPWELRLLEHRRKNFAVMCAPSAYHDDEISLSMTTNGSQWFSIGFMEEERPKIIAALAPDLLAENARLREALQTIANGHAVDDIQRAVVRLANEALSPGATSGRKFNQDAP